MPSLALKTSHACTCEEYDTNRTTHGLEFMLDVKDYIRVRMGELAKVAKGEEMVTQCHRKYTNGSLRSSHFRDTTHLSSHAHTWGRVETIDLFSGGGPG